MEPDGPTTRTSQIGRYGGYGITLGLSIALFAWLGMKADEWLGTRPVFVLCGTFLGFGAGFYHMYHELVVAPRESRDSGES